jgi:hypothetical protein
MLNASGEVVAVTANVGGKLWWAEPMLIVQDNAECSVLYRAGIACGQITRDDVDGIERDRAALSGASGLKLEAFDSKWLAWRPQGELPPLTIDPRGAS